LTALATVAPEVPAARYEQRVRRLQSVAVESGISAVLVGVGADLRYLTGYGAHESERLTMLVVPAAGPARLVAPRLEATPAHASAAATAGLVEVVAWEETDDPISIVAGLVAADADAAAEAAGSPVRIAIGDRTWSTFLLGLQAAMPGVEWGLASAVLRDLRITKDPEEVELLRLAAEAADRVIESIVAGRLVGRTEADVAREIRDRLVAEGHDTAEFAIVASGPNSASPHHGAGGRLIGAGEPIVLDIGGSLGGYASDTTRTVWVTGGDDARGPDDDFRTIHALVRDAQAAGTAAAVPGVACERVDAVARDLITRGGFGERFIHRLGHGIGLEGHEDPYLVAGNQTTLQPGMAFSVEPGIYLEGRYGVRIEDIVVCGEHGPQVLNRSSRDLLVVDG
jgi:Xaa-Pro aminopeptidase